MADRLYQSGAVSGCGAAARLFGKPPVVLRTLLLTFTAVAFSFMLVYVCLQYSCVPPYYTVVARFAALQLLWHLESAVGVGILLPL